MVRTVESQIITTCYIIILKIIYNHHNGFKTCVGSIWSLLFNSHVKVALSVWKRGYLPMGIVVGNLELFNLTFADYPVVLLFPSSLHGKLSLLSLAILILKISP